MYLLQIFLPLFGSIVSLVLGRLLSPKGIAFVTCYLIVMSVCLSFLSFLEVGLCRCPVYIKLSPWIDCEMFDASWGFMFDSLTVIMCFVVTSISALVHIYSTAYMNHDPNQPRFMCYLSLFTFFMLMLITSDNFLQLFFGWEGVGLCSYLLINFWFTRLQANKSAIKAMIVNRVGDFGLAIAIFLTFLIFKTVDFCSIFSLVCFFSGDKTFFLGFSVKSIFLISALLFVGVAGKSAQLILHTWLPDAMEGPTPVSALIHAATMVTAGVFLIIRCSPIFEYSSNLLFFISVLGAATAFFSASVGVFQNDLKKIIAYSTCSQLGYMIFACGLSNYSVSVFHVFNHAYFKALLFLSAGSIIHALLDEQDMRRMGGAIQVLPFTYSVILIGSLALMGFPFLTGFYSKDVILETAFSKYCFSGTFSHWLGIFSACITAFYSLKLIYLVFLSNPNGFRFSIEQALDAPPPMAFTQFVLGLSSIFVGYLCKDMFIGLGSPFWNNAIFVLPNNLNVVDAEFIPFLIKFIPLFVSLIGAFFSFIAYHIFSIISFELYSNSNCFSSLYTFFNKKWFLDRFQNEFFVSPLLNLGYGTTYKLVDKGLIEFFGPSGLTKFVLIVSKQSSLLHSGKINQYSFLTFILLVVCLGLALTFLSFDCSVISNFAYTCVLFAFLNSVFK